MDMPNMDKTDREVLNRFAQGWRPRAIGLDLDLETATVDDTLRTLCKGDRSTAGKLVAVYDQARQQQKPTGRQDQPAEAEPDLPQVEIVPAAELADLAVAAQPQWEPPAALEPAPPAPAAPEPAGQASQLIADLEAVVGTLAGADAELPAVAHAHEVVALAEQLGPDTPPALASAVRLAVVAMGTLLAEYDRERRRRELGARARFHQARLTEYLEELTALAAGAAPPDAVDGVPPVPVDLTADKRNRDTIRRWAVLNGHSIPDRGVIPRLVVEQWWAEVGSVSVPIAA